MTSGAVGAESVLSGRYRLLEPLASGGMGTVWRGTDLLLDREVAIKEVRLPPGLDAEARETMRRRTIREAQAAARLRHPAIVTIYDVVEQDDRPWIVMEYVAAPTLADVIRTRGPLPPARVAAIGLRILDAMVTAHAAGVQHRDIKPANVMLDEAGRVVLTDFGIARHVGDETLTSAGLLVGSPDYLSPERARGLPSHGLAGDLWSLGATMYDAVEGHRPFQRDGALPTLAAVVMDEPPPPKLAGPLRPVIDRLLIKNPDHRIDAGGTRVMLQRVIRGRPSGSTMPIPPSDRPTVESGLVRNPAGAGTDRPGPTLSDADATPLAVLPPTPPAPTPPAPGRPRRRWGRSAPGPAPTPHTTAPLQAAPPPQATPSPGAASTPETASTPQTASTPETASTPQTPAAPETPSAPEAASTPEAAALPGIAFTSGAIASAARLRRPWNRTTPTPAPPTPAPPTPAQPIPAAAAPPTSTTPEPPAPDAGPSDPAGPDAAAPDAGGSDEVDAGTAKTGPAPVPSRRPDPAKPAGIRPAPVPSKRPDPAKPAGIRPAPPTKPTRPDPVPPDPAKAGRAPTPLVIPAPTPTSAPPPAPKATPAPVSASKTAPATASKATPAPEDSTRATTRADLDRTSAASGPGPARTDRPVARTVDAPRRSKRVLVLTGLVVLLLATVAGLVVPGLLDGDDPGPQAGPAATVPAGTAPASASVPAGTAASTAPTGTAAASTAPASTAPTSPRPTPSSSATPPRQAGGAAVAAPVGFTRYTDPRFGFSVIVPDGWRPQRPSSVQVDLEDPDTGRYLRIETSDTPLADPYTNWLDYEQSFPRKRADYRNLGIRRVAYRPAEGWSTADWEFINGGAHVRNRNVRVSDARAHAIYWSTPTSLWSTAESQRIFDLAAASFVPAPVGR